MQTLRNMGVYIMHLSPLFAILYWNCLLYSWLMYHLETWGGWINICLDFHTSTHKEIKIWRYWLNLFQAYSVPCFTKTQFPNYFLVNSLHFCKHLWTPHWVIQYFLQSNSQRANKCGKDIAFAGRMGDVGYAPILFGIIVINTFIFIISILNGGLKLDFVN